MEADRHEGERPGRDEGERDEEVGVVALVLDEQLLESRECRLGTTHIGVGYREGSIQHPEVGQTPEMAEQLVVDAPNPDSVEVVELRERAVTVFVETGKVNCVQVADLGARV